MVEQHLRHGELTRGSYLRNVVQSLPFSVTFTLKAPTVSQGEAAFSAGVTEMLRNSGSGINNILPRDRQVSTPKTVDFQGRRGSGTINQGRGQNDSMGLTPVVIHCADQGPRAIYCL